MKNTITLLFFCLLIASGCKKDNQDQKLEIVGLNTEYDVELSKVDRDDGIKSGRNSTEYANSKYTATLDKEYKYSVKVIGKADSFNCQIILDGKTIHHADGKLHEMVLTK